MKLLWILGLIISISGFGEVPDEGTELTVTEATVDILTNEPIMELEGSMLCSEPLQVRITRSASGMNDEFCCGITCHSGNGETREVLEFTPGGMANWYVHYYPTQGSYETIQYTFTAGNESRTITVHFDYTAQGTENVQEAAGSVQKVLRDGILYIIKNNKTYPIL